MPQDVMQENRKKEDDLSLICHHHDRLKDVFESHGIPTQDQALVLKSCAQENLSEKLTLLQIANVFEILPEWLAEGVEQLISTHSISSCDASQLERLRVYKKKKYETWDLWTEKLIFHKQQGLQPKVIFVKSKATADSRDASHSVEFSDSVDASDSSDTSNKIITFIELTKKIKNNMVWRTYQSAEPPCWQEALWLVENAGLPYRGIMLESGPYQGLLQQTVLPVKALSQGGYWSLPYPKSAMHLNHYAEKLRYTIPRATSNMIRETQDET